MSTDSNMEFLETYNDEIGGEPFTTVRFPLSAERAEELLREFVSTGRTPPIDMIDEIHILVSPTAIKRAYDAIPRPDLELTDDDFPNVEK